MADRGKHGGAPVRLIEYTPDLFGALRAAAERLGVASLRHRPFVDYYYTDNPWCKLHLLTAADGAVAGMIGVDSMRFVADGRPLRLGFATNFHAAQPGAGGYLYLHWMKSSPFGLVFGGSEDTHRILHRQGWTYFPGVKTLVLNRPYAARPGESVWRRLAKRVLTRFRRTPAARFAARVPPFVAERITVHEEDRFADDMLPRTSPFSFRFAPELEYLQWRYRTGLSFVRYRLFRVRTDGRTSGYVVLNDGPHRIAVAHCDGESPCELAYGVLRSLVAATEWDRGIREILLTCAHAEMGRIYRHFGFRSAGADRPFAVGSRRGPVDLAADPSRWLINFDWGDNGLRAPFLDQNPSEGSWDGLQKLHQNGLDGERRAGAGPAAAGAADSHPPVSLGEGAAGRL